jgi:sulfate transport system permease protein
MFNVLFGLFAAYVLSRYNFWGRNALIVTIIRCRQQSPTAVAGFALLLLWGPYGILGRFLAPHGIQTMFTAGAIILANIFVTFPLAFGVIKPVFDTMSRSLEEASATIGATRIQTFWHVTLPSLRGAIVSGALLTFARALGSLVRRFSSQETWQGELRQRRYIYLRSLMRAKLRQRMQSRLSWRYFHF